MRFMKGFFLALALFALLGSAHAAAVFSVTLRDTSVSLDTFCTRNPLYGLADGTVLDILWDRNANGRDDTFGIWVPGWQNRDSLAILCRVPPTCSGTVRDSVNYNSFSINGVSQGRPQGQFSLTTPFRAFGPSAISQWLPQPDSFYVRVCLDSIYWESDIFSPVASASPATIYLRNWRCIHRAPPDWEATAAAVKNFRASDTTYCDGVHLRWDPYPAYGDSIFLYRSDTLIARVPATDTSYIFTSAVPGVQKQYSAIARRAINKRLSPIMRDFGYRGVTPAAVTGVTASDDSTSRVRISWNFTSSAGIDSFVVLKDGVEIHRDTVGSPQARHWTYPTADPARHNFCVAGWNRWCIYGPMSCDSGGAITIPCRADSVQASDGQCNTTLIRWAHACNALHYRLWRTNQDGTSPFQIAIVDDPTHSYSYSAGLAGTTYRYCVMAYNNAGSATDSLCDTGFKIAAPNAPASVQATDNTSCTNVVVTWTPPSGGAAATYYLVKRSGVQFDSVLATSPLTSTDVGGAPGTTYTYGVFAGNACGAQQSLTDQGTRMAIPGQVSGVTASDSTNCTGVAITWNSIANADSFYIDRNDTTNPIQRILGGTGVTSAFDSTGAPGVVYQYYVRAVNACGRGLLSTANAGSRKNFPGQPQNVRASDTLCTGVLVQWNTMTADSGFKIYRDSLFIKSVASGTTSYLDTLVSAGTHSYKVSAKNLCGEGAFSAIDGGTRLALVGPVLGIEASDTMCATIRVAWSAIAGADSFAVLRNDSIIGRVAAGTLVFNDNAAIPDTIYSYNVKAHNNCGLGPQGTPDFGKRRGMPPMVPEVDGSSNSCDTIAVSWLSVANADTFYVLRDNVQIAAVAGNLTLFVDRTASAGPWHQYRIVSKNSCGAALPSPADSGRRAIAPTLPTGLSASIGSCLGIDVNWSASTGEFTTYAIKRDGVVLTSTIPHDSLHYFDNTATAGNHYYHVAAVNALCGPAVFSSDSAHGTRLDFPGVPQNVQATRTRCDSIVITWQAAGGAYDGYEVFQGDSMLASLGATILRYEYQPPVGAYSFKVRSFSAACGNGVFSDSTNGIRLQRPTMPGSFAATVNRCDGVLLSWATSSGAYAGYVLTRDGTIVDTLGPSITQKLDTSATVASHEYKLFAYSLTCTNSDTTEDVNGSRLPLPTAPTNVAATDTSCFAAYVTWSPSTGTFHAYRVYRDAAMAATVIPPDTHFVDAVAMPNVFHRYTVTAFDSICGASDSTAGANGKRLEGATTPTGLTATGTCAGVDLRWHASTGTFAEYRIFRNSAFLITLGAPDTVYSDTAVVPAVTYNYRVAAYAAGCGLTDSSNVASAARIPIPTQVLGTRASLDNCAGIVVQWDTLVGMTRFRIYREGALFDSVTGGDGSISYFDGNALPHSTHSYMVDAVSACGIGPVSNASVGFRPGAPFAVQGFAASDTSCQAIFLQWQDDSTETHYVVVRDSTHRDTLPANTVFFKDSLVAAGEHSYKVYGLNQCGDGPQTAAILGLRIPGVSQVTGLACSQTFCDRVVLVWNNLPNETGYNLYREGSFFKAVAANETTYTDTLAAIGQNAYNVSGVNVCGEGQLSVQVLGRRMTVPVRVASVTATHDSCTSITVSWVRNDTTAEWYILYRNNVRIDSFAPGVLTFRDSPLAGGTVAYYQVQAYNHCGFAARSDSVMGLVANVPARVQLASAISAQCSTVTLCWHDLADELSYFVYRDNDTTNAVGSTGANDTCFADHVGGLHTYRVRATNVCGVGLASGGLQGFGTIHLPAPTGLTATTDNPTAVYLRWSHQVGADSFRVLRGDVTAGFAHDTVFADMGGTPDTVYAYRVIGFNECGNGDTSVAVNGRRLGILPPVPCTATDGLCDSVVVAWNAVQNADSLQIRRNGTRIGSTNGAGVRFVDRSGLCDTVYTYLVVAYNISGEGQSDTGNTGWKRCIPTPILQVVATDSTCAEVTICWTNTSDEDSFRVYRNGVILTRRNANDTCYTDASAVSGVRYLYRVEAMNICGTGVSAADSGGRYPLPGRPVMISASSGRCDGILVRWHAVARADSYAVLRNDTTIAIGFTADTTYLDAQAPIGTAQNYYVAAQNRCGRGVHTTPPLGGLRLTPPGAPSNVNASDTLCNAIQVTWQSTGGTIDSFHVYRDGTLVSRTGAAATQYLDPLISGGHRYWVRSYDTVCGESDTSRSDSGHAYAPLTAPQGLIADTAITCDTIRIHWLPLSDATAYVISRDGGTVVGTTADTFYHDGSNQSGGTHEYRVSGTNVHCGRGDSSQPANGDLSHLSQFARGVQAIAGCSVRVFLGHCAGISSDEFLISKRNGPYAAFATLSPTADSVQLHVPDTTCAVIPNCRIKVISHHGARADTSVASNLFALDCRCDAVDEFGYEIPQDYFLDQNFPNPFNPSTTIRFGLPKESAVNIEVFDLTGRQVATLGGGRMPAGVHSIVWDCSGCPTGMYIIRMQAGDRTMLRKMLLMK